MLFDTDDTLKESLQSMGPIEFKILNKYSDHSESKKIPIKFQINA